MQILIWTLPSQRPSVRLSRKCFPLNNYAVRKRFVACAYENNSTGKYKQMQKDKNLKLLWKM